MRIGYRLQALVAAALSIGAGSSIDQGKWPFLDRAVVVERVGPDNSDYIALHLKIVDGSGRTIGTLPPLNGPVFLAPVNRQIFACESNSIAAAAGAEIFDAEGGLAFSFRHLGFLRDCGLTADKRLYWLHYSVVEQSVPANTVVVLAPDGSIVHRSTFSVGKTLRFAYRGQEYTLDIQSPELPG